MDQTVSEYLSWAFLPLREGEINSDPFSDEFFSAESLAASLVREPIQNSLDACAGSAPVRMRYTFAGSGQQLSPDRAGHWLNKLRPHLEAKNSGLKSPPTSDEPLDFLLIEDFGTFGLDGDPLQLRESGASGQRNDFFYFWRNLGRSGKSDSDRGRWGLGKSVFPAASRIHTIFGLTRRVTDQRVLLYGQSVLGTHETAEGHFTSYGFFGEIRDAGSVNEIALPSERADVVSEFSRDFRLARGDEPGFSVVIPYPTLDLFPSEIVRETLLHFFYPILAGDLEVEVVDENGITRLAKDTIRQVSQTLKFHNRSRLTPEILTELMEMAEFTQLFRPDELVMLPAAPPTKPPRWSAELFVEESSLDARTRFNQGEVVGFRVPVVVSPAQGDPHPSYFDAFFQRAPSLVRGDYHFIRQGITITEIKTPTQRGVRAMFVAKDPVLCGLLGDSENPAHTQWEERNRHFQDKYKDGVVLLRFLKQSLANIADFLIQAQEGIDTDLLSGLFFVELDQTEKSSSASGTRDARGERPFAPFAVDVHSNHEAFVLARCEGGFKISAKPSDGASPVSLEIEVAYEVRRGDPFRKYSPLDFDLARAPFEVLTKGAHVQSQAGNRLQVIVAAPEFTVLVQGFDPHRDVRVRVVVPLSAHDSEV
jgi:hypothetical protein